MMPIANLLTIWLFVLAAAGVTVAAFAGFGASAIVVALVVAAGVRLWSLRR